MSIPVLRVDYPGLLTTVQDLGRFGYQDLGVPVSGSMDSVQSRLANILIGNSENDAVLEITILGPKLIFLEDVIVALTGADLSPRLNGEAIVRWQPINVKKGSELSFGECRDGARGYLAVSGNGFNVPIVMGSRSTYLPGNFGGYHGRALQKGDVLSSISANHNPETKLMPSEFVEPNYADIKDIRIVIGSRENFSISELDKLYNSDYKISNDSDRVGYLLEGSLIEINNSSDIISEGNAPGAIQVSGDGVMTILLSDKGTIGGYSKIASVINADLNLLAQLMPGDSISFTEVSLDEARNAFIRQEKFIEHVVLGTDFNSKIYKNSVKIDGDLLEVVSDDGEIFSYSSLQNESTKKSQFAAEIHVEDEIFNLDAEIENN